MAQIEICGLSDDEIAQVCYDHFNHSLTKKGKPQSGREWTILAAVLIQIAAGNNTSCYVASMGTGSKCVGQGKLSRNGDILHDSHAEVLARRAFLRFLYSNLNEVYSGKESKLFDLDPTSKKCHLKKGVSVLFFSSHTPCGDGSIIPKSEWVDDSSTELQMTSECTMKPFNKTEDLEPPRKRLKEDDVYRTGAKCVKGGPQDPRLPGTEHHVAGVLRTKPGRGDQTLSMSCSDKLAKWNILGIQGSLIMNFLETPIFISRIILGESPFCPAAMQRAILDRFDATRIEQYPFKQQKITITQSRLEFQFCKQAVCRTSKTDPQPCPSSIIWCLTPSKQLEVAVEGKKQGATKKTQNKPSGRLEVCKKNLLQTFTTLLQITRIEDLPVHLRNWVPKLDHLTYFQAKQLAVSYVEMWRKLRVEVMPTWTSKGIHLMEFTTEEK